MSRRYPLIGVNSRGTSMIDAMVAMMLLALVMAAGYGSLISQMRTHATQTQVAQSMNQARMALQVVADQVAMAGFGVPVATSPSRATDISTATATQFTFWTRVNAAHTYLTAAAAKNAAAVSVVSTAGVVSGATVYITDNINWYVGTVQSVTATTVSLTPVLTYAFAAGSPLMPVEQVTFQLVGNELQRNAHRLIGNVTAFSFAYDSTTLTAIRQITMQLSVQTAAVDTATRQRLSVTVTTQVAPPNLAL